MGTRASRAAAWAALTALGTIVATPALAQAQAVNGADTAWMIVATAFVLMMTIPGLALFYSGMVRKKNVLATMAQSLATVALVSILWVAFGYSLVFVGGDPWLGTLDRWFLSGMTMDSINPTTGNVIGRAMLADVTAFAEHARDYAIQAHKHEKQSRSEEHTSELQSP